jgi:hypothetical protein
MCDLVLGHDDGHAGARLTVCEDPPSSVARHISTQLKVHDEFLGLLERTRGTRVDPPLVQVMKAFLPAAKTVVLERDYFDLDYRSEFTATHETSFAASETDTSRLHFFAGTVDAKEDLPQAVQTLARSYLGYVVVRPQAQGAVGRSLIPLQGAAYRLRPAQSGDDVPSIDATPLLVGASLQDRIRTHVTEWNELFGTLMWCTGVPFMQQDGHLLRCAHVSAWVCHYTAVLRGFVVRRASATFHTIEDDSGAYGRRYPSDGLTHEVLSSVLRKLDLPPEVTDRNELERQYRRIGWHDRALIKEREWEIRPQDCTDCSYCDDQGGDGCRQECRTCRLRLGRVPRRQPQPPQDGVEPDEGAEAAWERKAAAWQELNLRENVTASVCRYLNSGLPVILADETSEHTKVIVGYTREADEVWAFITQDDQRAPLLIEVIDDVLTRFDDRGFSLITPLPHGVWMSGKRAEQLGAQLLRTFMKEGGRGRPAVIQNGPWHGLYGRVDETFNEMSSQFAVRSYVTLGSDFKVSLRDRVHDSDVRRTIALCRLPKFVWVTEMVDREERDKPDRGCVVATVVLDASFVSEFPSGVGGTDAALGSRSPLLFIHVPGWVSRFSNQGRAMDAKLLEPAPAVGSAVVHYESGRWGHRGADGASPPSAAHAYKSAFKS